MKSATMKTSNIFLPFILVSFCLMGHVSAQHLELPSELVVEYFNITLDDIYVRCDQIGEDGYCRSVKGLDEDFIKLQAGERLILRLVNLARRIPSITSADWDRLIEERCTTNDYLFMLLKIGMENAEYCVRNEIQVTEELNQRIRVDYIGRYCSRVRRLAMDRYAHTTEDIEFQEFPNRQISK